MCATGRVYPLAAPMLEYPFRSPFDPIHAHIKYALCTVLGFHRTLETLTTIGIFAPNNLQRGDVEETI